MSFHFRATQGWPSQERPEHVAPGWRARIWVARPTVSVVVVVCVAAVELAFFGYLIGTESTGGTERATEIQQSSFQGAFETARQAAFVRSEERGRAAGERAGRAASERAGADAGARQGAAAVERRQAAIAAAEAAAAAAAAAERRGPRGGQRGRRRPRYPSPRRSRFRPRLRRPLRRPNRLSPVSIPWASRAELAREPSFVLVGEDDLLALRPHHEPIGDAPLPELDPSLSFQPVSGEGRGEPA